MKLDELIEGFDPGQEFLIGARSSYFFGGNKTEYETCIDGISREHKSATEALLRRAKGIKEDARSYIKHHNGGKTVTISFEFDKERVGDPDYSNEIHKKLMDIETLNKFYSRIKDYISSTDTIEKCQYELSLPTYREREADCSKSIINPDILLITIPGTQAGKYWDMDEVRAEKAKKEALCKKQGE